MKLTRLIVGTVAAVVVITIVMRRCGREARTFAKATDRATWGQILMVGEETEHHTSRHVAELYDPLSNSFAARPPVIHQGRGGATTSVIPAGRSAGKVLVAGGFTDGSGPLASTELYDPATNSFADGPQMNTDRDDHTATAIAAGPNPGEILIVGGDTADLYDPRGNKFLAGPRTAHFRIDHTATVIPSGPNARKILLAGGLDDLLAVIEHYNPAATEIYDPATNSFAAGPAMNVARQFHTASVIPSGPNAGKILLVGGMAANLSKALASTEIYDPATSTFAPPRETPVMKVARTYHTATIISGGPNAGRILIAGGQQGEAGESLSSTELYDPATNRFVPGPTMHSNRSQHAAIVIASGPNVGKILITAGVTIQCDKSLHCGMVLLGTTEVYNPVRNTIAPGPTMYGAPGQVAAVQLPPSPLSHSPATAGKQAPTTRH